MRKSLDERRAQLATDIEQADRLRALARDPEVVRWFEARDKSGIETILIATTDDARLAAIADLKALRSLRGHLLAVERASDIAIKKLNDMNALEDQQNA